MPLSIAGSLLPEGSSLACPVAMQQRQKEQEEPPCPSRAQLGAAQVPAVFWAAKGTGLLGAPHSTSDFRSDFRGLMAPVSPCRKKESV